nr:MAG TPA: hypothetical protein [Caudoviricetes sp.]
MRIYNSAPGGFNFVVVQRGLYLLRFYGFRLWSLRFIWGRLRTCPF